MNVCCDVLDVCNDGLAVDARVSSCCCVMLPGVMVVALRTCCATMIRRWAAMLGAGRCVVATMPAAMVDKVATVKR